MTALTESGVAGVTVDGIAARLGLTKGSFHHHFEGVVDYRGQLLARFESDAGIALEQAMSAEESLTPEAVIVTIPARHPFDRRREAAVRAWALHDPEAHETLARVDTARLAALTTLWERVIDDADDASTAAMIPYLVAIGASMATPPPSERALLRVFALLAALVPAVGEASVVRSGQKTGLPPVTPTTVPET
ncbi:TetR/AcrR family transcriptional regulator [Georgenia sp. MJ170]|uniref:TetR/AcrR family transcriptional regulator n=1 Tax=Georgenia sunbinii TaxID=3117728 RepID=UPI002F261B4B